MFERRPKQDRKRVRTAKPTLFVESLEDRLTPTVYVVNSLGDDITSADGLITLREAVHAAQGVVAGGEIDFAGGDHATVEGTFTGDVIRFALPAGNQTIALTGLDETTVNGNSSLLISGSVKIDGGFSPATRLTLDAGGTAKRHIHVTPTGNLFVNNLTLSNGMAQGANGAAAGLPGDPGLGGGIYSQGRIVVQNMAFVNNAAKGGKGANNPGGMGGTGGTAFGGAINVLGASAAFTILNSTFVNNTATGGDGGTGLLNGLGGGAGGGALALSSATASIVRNNTFILNAATGGKTGGVGASAVGAGAALSANANFTLSNNLIGNGAGVAGSANIVGGLTTGSNNLFAHGSNFGLGATNANLSLGTFGNYGGQTNTVPLLPGSPALNAGTGGGGADARGNVTVGTRDIGSFESQGFTLTPTTGIVQRTKIGTTFATPLTAAVTANNSAEPVNGGVVTLAFPAGNVSLPATAVIANGTIAVTANATVTPGSYNVTMNLPGVGLATFTLTNQIPTSLKFITQPVNSTASGSIIKGIGGGAVVVEVEDQGGNPILNDNSTVIRIQAIGGPGNIVSGTTSLTATNGTVSFGNLTINKGGLNYALQASNATLAMPLANSTLFSITANQLVYTLQPVASMKSGTLFNVTVSAKDADDDFVTSFNQTVNLSLSGGVGGAILEGTISKPATAGNVTFTGLAIKKAADGYRLTANSTTFVDALSNAFNITASKLLFAATPASPQRSGDLFSISANALDETGGVASNYNGTLSLSLANGPGTLSGNLTRPASSGSVAFSNLSINRSFNGYLFKVADTVDATLANTTVAGLDVTARYLRLIAPTATMNVRAGQAFNVTTQAYDIDGVISPTFTDSILLSVAGYTAPAGSVVPAAPNLTMPGANMTAPVNPGDSVQFGGIQLHRGGTYTLKVSTPNAVKPLIENATVVTVYANKLAFTSVPAEVRSGNQTLSAADISYFNIQVQGLDDENKPATIGANLALSVSATTRPGNDYAFAGNTTKSALNRIDATFDRLTIAKWGNYRFLVTPSAQIVPGLTVVNSPAAPGLGVFSTQVTARSLTLAVNANDPTLALFRAAAGQTITLKAGLVIKVPELPATTVFGVFLTRSFAIDITGEVDKNFNKPVFLTLQSATGGATTVQHIPGPGTAQGPNPQTVRVNAVNGFAQFQSDIAELGAFQLQVSSLGLIGIGGQAITRSSQSRRRP